MHQVQFLWILLKGIGQIKDKVVLFGGGAKSKVWSR